MNESKKVLALKWSSDSDVDYVDPNVVLERGNGSLPANSRGILQSQVTSVQDLNFNRKSESRSDLHSREIGARAMRRILELEPNTTLNHAERTII
jgi:hypothetical protein